MSDFRQVQETKKTSEFQERNQEYQSVLSEYRDNLKRVMSHGPEKAVAQHRSRGKLLARERISQLTDPGTPFLELSPFAAFNQYDNTFPSAGIVTGIGIVEGRECMIVANDAT
jgi:3-methylcrotonyl-CoA carboxylase beta subunit